MNKNCSKSEQIRKNILEFIIHYMEKHGYSPSFREIGAAVGLRSTSTVHRHIHKMLDMNILETDCIEGQSRALRVPNYKFVRIN